VGDDVRYSLAAFEPAAYNRHPHSGWAVTKARTIMRILAGQLKGRTLLSPAGRSTRPMTARVKKSLFDMLSSRLAGAVVVDLYCGVGTLGLEALSRGAAKCFFAEHHPKVLDCLRRNIDSLGVREVSCLWTGDVTARLAGWLDGIDDEVDVVFVDPPYVHVQRQDIRTVIAKIFPPLAGSLAREARVVLRTPRQVEAPDEQAGLKLVRLRHYGDMSLWLYEGPAKASPASRIDDGFRLDGR